MTIAGLSDIYIYSVGLLYPAYQTLLHRDDVEKTKFLQKYWTVFALSFVAFTEMTLEIMKPLLRIVQMIGVTLMVIPATNFANALYSNVVIPTFEKNREKIQQSVKSIWNLGSNLFHNLKQMLSTNLSEQVNTN
jgi:hypothetical protein